MRITKDLKVFAAGGGIVVGENSIIKAGSIISRDVPPDSFV